MTYNLKMNIL